jgi:hypothetical protein
VGWHRTAKPNPDGILVSILKARQLGVLHPRGIARRPSVIFNTNLFAWSPPTYPNRAPSCSTCSGGSSTTRRGICGGLVDREDTGSFDGSHVWVRAASTRGAEGAVGSSVE